MNLEKNMIDDNNRFFGCAIFEVCQYHQSYSNIEVLNDKISC